MNEFLNTSALWAPGTMMMAGLLFGSGFFSASETALFYMTRDELRRLQNSGAGGRLAANMMRQPDRLLTVVLFWNLIINVTYFAVSVEISKKLISAGHPTTAGIISVASLVIMILFGEIFPKSIAVPLRHPIAALAGWPLAIAVRALSPILPILTTITLALRRAIAPGLKLEPYIDVEDIERAIDSTDLTSELALLEQRVLGRILEISEMRNEELMRPRGSFAACSTPVDFAKLQQLGPAVEYVFLTEDRTEAIHRVIPLVEMSSVPMTDLESVSEEVLVVPWCGRVSATLSLLRTRILSTAVVINEYGEDIGVLTEDDIIDTLINPDSSRASRLLHREPVTEVGENRFLADGVTTLRYLGQRVGFDYEDRDDGLLTVAALMHDELEKFPEIDDVCHWEGLTFRVVATEGPGKSIQVEISKPPSTKNAPAEPI